MYLRACGAVRRQLVQGAAQTAVRPGGCRPPPPRREARPAGPRAVPGPSPAEEPGSRIHAQAQEGFASGVPTVRGTRAKKTKLWRQHSRRMMGRSSGPTRADTQSLRAGGALLLARREWGSENFGGWRASGEITCWHFSSPQATAW